MKTIRITALAVAGLLAMGIAWAADSRDPQPGAQNSQDAMARMQEHMQRMQEQMHQIQRTQDPQTRQRLMREHWQTMRSMMQNDPWMMDCPMMGGGMAPPSR